jgi:hypothetical protein
MKDSKVQFLNQGSTRHQTMAKMISNMNDERQTILKALHHNNFLTQSLGRDTWRMLKKALSPAQLIEKVTREEKAEDCLTCNGQPLCRLFLAFAYLELGTPSKAKNLVEEAIAGFRIRDSHWNEAMCHWLFGTILLQQGDRDSAARSLYKALELSYQLVNELRVRGNFKRIKEYEGPMQQILRTLKSITTYP